MKQVNLVPENGLGDKRKKKTLITELAAAPSQTTRIHASMHMHAQMRIPDPTAGRKWDGMFQG